MQSQPDEPAPASAEAPREASVLIVHPSLRHSRIMFRQDIDFSNVNSTMSLLHQYTEYIDRFIRERMAPDFSVPLVVPSQNTIFCELGDFVDEWAWQSVAKKPTGKSWITVDVRVGDDHHVEVTPCFL